MTKPLQFNIFVEEREDAFVGYCMELGLVARGLVKDEVLEKVSKMTVRHFGFAVANDRIQDAFKPVGDDVWQRFMRSKAHCGTMPESVRANSETTFTVNQNAYASAC
jgi:hypothetical protein